MGFYLVPYCQPSPHTRFLPITAIRTCHFLPVHHFGTACLAGSKVNIQQAVFKFEAISIRSPSNLSVLIIFFCILEVLVPFIFGMRIILLSGWSPTCSKLTIRPNAYAPMGTSELSTSFFTQVLRLSDRIDFLHARIIFICSDIRRRWQDITYIYIYIYVCVCVCVCVYIQCFL